MKKLLFLFAFIIFCMGCASTDYKLPKFNTGDVVRDIESNVYGIIYSKQRYSGEWYYIVIVDDIQVSAKEKSLELHKRCLWRTNGLEWVDPEPTLAHDYDDSVDVFKLETN